MTAASTFYSVIMWSEYYSTFVWFWILLWNSENAGLLGLTRVGSRRVVQISAGFMIFFSILGKAHAFMW